MLETRLKGEEVGAPLRRRPRRVRRALIVAALLLASVAGLLTLRGGSPGGDEQLLNIDAPAASAPGDQAGSGIESSAASTPAPVQDPPPASQPPATGSPVTTTSAPVPAAATVQPAPAAGTSGSNAPQATTETSNPPGQSADAPPAGVAPPPPPPDSPAGTATRAATGPVCLNGVFTTIFGGPGQVYFLTDDTGKQTQVLLEEKVAEAAGGALALDRQRVTIRGDAAGASPSGNPQVRATSIRLAGGCP